MRIVLEFIVWGLLICFDILGLTQYVTSGGTLVLFLLFSAWPIFAFGILYRLLVKEREYTNVFVLLSFITHFALVYLIPVFNEKLATLFFDDVSSEAILYFIICFVLYAVEYWLCTWVHPYGRLEFYREKKPEETELERFRRIVDEQ